MLGHSFFLGLVLLQKKVSGRCFSGFCYCLLFASLANHSIVMLDSKHTIDMAFWSAMAGQKATITELNQWNKQCVVIIARDVRFCCLGSRTNKSDQISIMPFLAINNNNNKDKAMWWWRQSRRQFWDIRLLAQLYFMQQP